LSWYKWAVRPALFALDAERAHDLTLAALRHGVVQRAIRATTGTLRDSRLQQQVFGLRFDNPIGLAAGLDKQGTAVPAWAALGLGFVEVGTVTPRPQPGNPRPRLFRLRDDRAVINRFGFNSVGAAGVAANLAAVVPAALPIGVNVGKNKLTDNAEAAADYTRAVEILHQYADYFVINVSSPNTSGLRDLQESATLRALVERVVNHAGTITSRRAIPVLVKVSPDMQPDDLLRSADAAVEGGAAGVIATNTTLARDGLRAPATLTSETGGLSGAPLRAVANDTCARLFRHLGRAIPIVGVGGVFTADDAYERIRAGATLVQVYTGLIYEGPTMITRLVRGLSERLRRDGFAHVRDAVGADVR
jgi:dihydroorotate dehydrogenase